MIAEVPSAQPIVGIVDGAETILLSAEQTSAYVVDVSKDTV